MILIEEKKCSKIPGETSLFISFEYNKEIVNIIRNCGTKYYHKAKKQWEVPITDLSTLVDKFCLLDIINFRLLGNTNISILPEINLSKTITKPFKYQEDGIKFGLSHNKWLLLDAPGLGKTLQILYIAQELKRKKEIDHCLIICGINALKSNWKSEIEKHTNLSCRILGERKRKSGSTYFGGVKERLEDLKSKLKEFFIITNIETLRSNDVVKEINNGKNNFDMIVVDEIHTCKSLNSQQGHNLLKLKNSKYKIGVTGTILMNDPLDLYVPLKWIDAEKSCKSVFKNYYCVTGGQFNNEILGYKNLNILKEQLNNYSLRRTKDLLDLPEKIIINEYIDMNSDHEIFYNNIKNGLLNQVDLVKINNSNLLALVARLRQATACPSILTSENITHSKLLRAKELIEEIVESGEKVVVFSTFKSSIQELEKYIKAYKDNYVICTGDTKDEVIDKNKEVFQSDDSCKIMLATWQKMGTGLTLTAARYMIFLDTPWTWADYEQAQDRIYRIGTKNKVTIYNLICKNTIDERVLNIVEDKQYLGDYIVDDKITEKEINSLRNYINELKFNTV